VPNGDEGTMGLEALHIAFRGEHPVFFYGQHYMGVIEAYIGALAYRLFGLSLFSLRISTLLLLTLFFIAIYFLTRLLYSRRVALVTLLLLSFASADMFIQELRAVGGAVETLLFGTTTLLFSTWLALHSQDDAKSGITLILYASSPLTALKPWSTRYLIGLLVAVPTLLWPLLRQSPDIERYPSFKKHLFFTKMLIIAAIFATGSLSTVLTFSALPNDIAANQQDRDFIHYLEAQHITHFYAGYWTCYRLMFMSEEHFICDGPDWLVQPRGRRYPPYRSMLDADPSTVYVFTRGSADDQSFMRNYAHTGKHYIQSTYGSYHIYRPT
jgi:hypothetical protein